MSGEQFAMPRAIERLREVRRTHADGGLVTIGTADPLNLAGIVTSGERIRATARNRIVYRDGVPVAVMESGVVRLLAAIDASTEHEVSNALRMRRVTTSVA
jgi:ATP-dependent Lhr-like helicase